MESIEDYSCLNLKINYEFKISSFISEIFMEYFSKSWVKYFYNSCGCSKPSVFFIL